MNEYPIPPEKIAPVQGYSAGIPWSMHLRAYDAYCKKYGPQQALIEGWCCGGFDTNELDMFIPGWREELSELAKLRDQVARLEAELNEKREGQAVLAQEVDRLEAQNAKLRAQVEQFKAHIRIERVKSRLMGVDDGMKACEKVIDAARLFCESTMAEMDELEGTQSASAPAEFMLLHEAVQEFDGTCK